MARRHFPGKDRAWLEQQLDVILEEKALGGTLGQWSEGDSNATTDRQISLQRRQQMIEEDLSTIDPAAYPPKHHKPIRRVSPSFW